MYFAQSLFIGFTVNSQYLPNSIDQLVFLVETHCVSCEVGAEFLAVMWMNFNLQRVKRLKYRTT
jgi:hypothetical protein